MKAIPVPLRERIMILYGQGRSTAQIAASLGFCEAAVRRVRLRYKQRGTLEPQTHLCGRKSLLTPKRRERLEQLVASAPDATLAELATRMDRPFGTSTLDAWLRQLGYRYKKNVARLRAGPSRRGEKEGPMARAVRQRAVREAGFH